MHVHCSQTYSSLFSKINLILKLNFESNLQLKFTKKFIIKISIPAEGDFEFMRLSYNCISTNLVAMVNCQK